MSFTPVSTLKGRSVCSAAQFTRDEIDHLIALAQQMKSHIESGGTIDALHGRVMTPLFFEDSSRTLSSFCAAMMRLGGNVVNFKVETSSVNKGETLQDTVRTLDAYSDVLVLRHPCVDALDAAVQVAQHPIMNAGNGSGEHPTQALLDIFTMHSELGAVDGLTIALIGDLKMGRTVHSLLKLLTRNFNLRRVYLVAPAMLQMPREVLESVQADLAKRNIELREETALTPELVRSCDVLYTTRLQKERFIGKEADTDAALASFAQAKADICIHKARLLNAKERMIVMHPLPRVDELSTDIDDDPRAAYFRQMRYGMFMRMAILYSVLA